MKIELPSGATPLDRNEIDGLIPDIHTQKELDLFEADNIARARQWAQRSRRLKKELLSVSGLLLLHKKMFEQVWLWAGTFRLTEKNIGIDPRHISTQLIQLCENTRYQCLHQKDALPEIAIRFHHELTAIHPFPNGNGRHARLATDLLLYYQGQPAFSWSGEALRTDSTLRREYINALKQVDREGDYTPLLSFALRK